MRYLRAAGAQPARRGLARHGHVDSGRRDDQETAERDRRGNQAGAETYLLKPGIDGGAEA